MHLQDITLCEILKCKQKSCMWNAKCTIVWDTISLISWLTWHLKFHDSQLDCHEIKFKNYERSWKTLSWSSKLFHDPRPLEDFPRTGHCQDHAGSYKIMERNFYAKIFKLFKNKFLYDLAISWMILGKMLNLDVLVRWNVTIRIRACPIQQSGISMWWC